MENGGKMLSEKSNHKFSIYSTMGAKKRGKWRKMNLVGHIGKTWRCEKNCQHKPLFFPFPPFLNGNFLHWAHKEETSPMWLLRAQFSTQSTTPGQMLSIFSCYVNVSRSYFPFLELAFFFFLVFALGYLIRLENGIYLNLVVDSSIPIM